MIYWLRANWHETESEPMFGCTNCWWRWMCDAHQMRAQFHRKLLTIMGFGAAEVGGIENHKRFTMQTRSIAIAIKVIANIAAISSVSANLPSFAYTFSVQTIGQLLSIAPTILDVFNDSFMTFNCQRIILTPELLLTSFAMKMFDVNNWCLLDFDRF